MTFVLPEPDPLEPDSPAARAVLVEVRRLYHQMMTLPWDERRTDRAQASREGSPQYHALEQRICALSARYVTLTEGPPGWRRHATTAGRTRLAAVSDTGLS